MSYTVPLDSLTTKEKLKVLQDIWADLRKDNKDLSLPAWHEQVINERVKLLEQGDVETFDITEAKQIIDDLVK